MYFRILAAAAALACLTFAAKAEPPKVGSVVTGIERIVFCVDERAAMALANTMVAASSHDEWMPIYRQLEATGVCDGLNRITIPAKIESVEWIGHAGYANLDTWVVHISDPSDTRPDIWLIYDEAPDAQRLFHPAGIDV